MSGHPGSNSRPPTLKGGPPGNESQCRLEVYNVLGQVIYSKDYGVLNKGSNIIIVGDNIWSNQASGIYYYKIISDNSIVSKKMLLLK